MIKDKGIGNRSQHSRRLSQPFDIPSFCMSEHVDGNQIECVAYASRMMMCI
jgi:hypothetical protein